MCLVKVRLVKTSGEELKNFENVAVIEFKEGKVMFKDLFLNTVCSVNIEDVIEILINTVDAAVIVKLR